tara:strand:+ start:1875 stop:2708 length:834 start_codon:yes stop_codon:yes gene_type:complete
MIRNPVVAGQFYENDPQKLIQSIENCFTHKFGPGKKPPSLESQKIHGIICPHAGYMYSGAPAAHAYHAISSQDIDLAVIIGPNHWGIGSDVATMCDGKWKTPLGMIEIDSDASSHLLDLTENVKDDFFSHTKDHSLEVQIPMLQTIFPEKLKILPIILKQQGIETAKEIGSAIADIAKTRKLIIIGSSDFTHYEENAFAYEQDKALIEPILKLNVEEFYNILKERRVSACGYGAIASTIVACKTLGATKGILLSYSTSGDITGIKDSVVGYGSIKFV